MSSINALSNNPIPLPSPEERVITFRVREPWVGNKTSAKITAGIIGAEQSLNVISKMEAQGVIFGGWYRAGTFKI